MMEDEIAKKRAGGEGKCDPVGRQHRRVVPALNSKTLDQLIQMADRPRGGMDPADKWIFSPLLDHQRRFAASGLGNQGSSIDLRNRG